jgi:hypothetical protein
MTIQKKLKALKDHLYLKAGVRMSNQWLIDHLHEYVFTEVGIFHVNESPEQFEDTVDFEIDTEPEPDNIPFSDPPEIDDPDFDGGDIDYPESPDWFEDKTTVSFGITSCALESINEFAKTFPYFVIEKSHYFHEKKRWLIFGYEKTDYLYSHYQCLTWCDGHAHNLANSTYGQCLTTYQLIKKDLERNKKIVEV